ncbi:MAG: hypothetical protein IT372_42520 [Polyangiaceae bacterium]|nr:hypothetical protein [Polyangiaceae bacterium]
MPDSRYSQVPFNTLSVDVPTVEPAPLTQDKDLAFGNGFVVRAPGVGEPVPNTAPVYLCKEGDAVGEGALLQPGDEVALDMLHPALVRCISGTPGQHLKVWG